MGACIRDTNFSLSKRLGNYRVPGEAGRLDTDENKHLFPAAAGGEIYMHANTVISYQTWDHRGTSGSQRKNRGRPPAPAWGALGAPPLFPTSVATASSRKPLALLCLGQLPRVWSPTSRPRSHSFTSLAARSPQRKPDPVIPSLKSLQALSVTTGGNPNPPSG